MTWPSHAPDPLNADDEAFDRAFRDAARRELVTPRSLFPRAPSCPPEPPHLLERRARYRRLVFWIVGAAGAFATIALAVGAVT